MRVIVDPELCEGNGVCQQVSPEVFRVGDDDRAIVLVEHPAETLRVKMETAVRRCPRRAIRLVED
jgi:ferredoxin